MQGFQHTSGCPPRVVELTLSVESASLVFFNHWLKVHPFQVIETLVCQTAFSTCWATPYVEALEFKSEIDLRSSTNKMLEDQIANKQRDLERAQVRSTISLVRGTHIEVCSTISNQPFVIHESHGTLQSHCLLIQVVPPCISPD